MINIKPNPTTTNIFQLVSKHAVLPKQMRMTGTFGKTTLFECEVLQPSAIYRPGEYFTLSADQINKHYGVHP